MTESVEDSEDARSKIIREKGLYVPSIHDKMIVGEKGE